ncbi:MAG: hypothetical protein QXL54_05025 [Candidatus Bathyarchaeia archaeon]
MTKEAALKEAQKSFLNKKLMLASISLALLIIFSVIIYHVFWRSSDVEFPLRAAIIDQVGANPPSSLEEMRKFNETASLLLKNAGFEVHYYGSESITVSLYRRLAKENYGIIILRTHSAVRIQETLVDFFTSEEYKPGIYSSELNSGLLAIGNYSWMPGKYYFAITPKFVEALEGSFPGSIIIAMGCSSLKSGYEEMADAFIKKDAKAYIGWTDPVSIIHSDNSTIRFLQNFLASNKSMSISEAVDECNKFSDPDPQWSHAKFSYRLKEKKIADYRLSDFIVNVAYFFVKRHGWEDLSN